MLVPSHSNLRAPCEREVLSVTSEPLQFMLTNCDDSGGRTAPYAMFLQLVLDPSDIDNIGLGNPGGAAFLDLHYIAIGNPATGTRPSFNLWGVKKVPDVGDLKYKSPITLADTKNAIIIPLFNPDTGLQLIDFSAADPEIDETVEGNRIIHYSADQKVYCRGCETVFATLVVADTGFAGSLMGQFVN